MKIYSALKKILRNPCRGVSGSSKLNLSIIIKQGSQIFLPAKVLGKFNMEKNSKGSGEEMFFIWYGINLTP